MTVSLSSVCTEPEAEESLLVLLAELPADCGFSTLESPPPNTVEGFVTVAGKRNCSAQPEPSRLTIQDTKGSA